LAHNRSGGNFSRVAQPKMPVVGFMHSQTPEGLQKLVESEIARITPVIKAAGVAVN
jgi:hypothetical protein